MNCQLTRVLNESRLGDVCFYYSKSLDKLRYSTLSILHHSSCPIICVCGHDDFGVRTRFLPSPRAKIIDKTHYAKNLAATVPTCYMRPPTPCSNRAWNPRHSTYEADAPPLSYVGETLSYVIVCFKTRFSKRTTKMMPPRVRFELTTLEL